MEERRESMIKLEARVASLESKVGGLDEKVDANTRITQNIKQDTSEIVSFFAQGKTVVGFIERLARLIKWISGLITALGIIWGLVYAYTHGLPPPDIKP
jgi:hypothetical protein